MLLLDMHPAAPTTSTLEQLLEAWAPHDHAVTGTCVVCEGETFRVERRGGLQAWACRECGSVLEDEVAPAA
jgi:ribosomal protein L37AE/L43A